MLQNILVRYLEGTLHVRHLVGTKRFRTAIPDAGPCRTVPYRTVPYITVQYGIPRYNITVFLGVMLCT